MNCCAAFYYIISFIFAKHLHGHIKCVCFWWLFSTTIVIDVNDRHLRLLSFRTTNPLFFINCFVIYKVYNSKKISTKKNVWMAKCCIDIVSLKTANQVDFASFRKHLESTVYMSIAFHIRSFLAKCVISFFLFSFSQKYA